MPDGMIAAAREALDAATRPLPDDARMGAYYYGFDRTGVGVIDAVLSAVAIAGKGSHHTDGWGDSGQGYYDGRPGLPPNPGDTGDGSDGGAAALIQRTADASAETVRALADAVAALCDENARLRDETADLYAGGYGVRARMEEAERITEAARGVADIAWRFPAAQLPGSMRAAIDAVRTALDEWEASR